MSVEPTEINCDSCFEVFEKERLFKCTTCMKQLEGLDAVTFFCGGCIMPHLRKSHEILDHKSMTPTICKTHKNLCSMFCANCEEVLCVNCVLKHTNHNLTSIKDRASDLRPKIFDLIANLSSFEISVRVTREKLNENKKIRTESYDKLVLDISSEMDALKLKILDSIKSEHEKIVKLEEESTKNYELLLQCQNDLRELLCCSDGIMVEQFKEKENQVSEIEIKELELGLRRISGVGSSASKQMTPLVEQFSDNFFSKIKLPNAVSLSENSFVYSKNCGSLYSVEYESLNVTVYECKFKEHKDDVSMSKNVLATFENDASIYCFQVFFLVQLNSSPIILIKINKVLQLFDVHLNCFRSMKSNLEFHQIPLFFTSISTSDVAEFVYWDKINNVVRQTNKESVKFECDSLPQIVSSWQDDSFVHFVNQKNDVVEIETHPSYPFSDSVIKYCVHGVCDISCISQIKSTVIIWSLSTSSLTFLRRLDSRSDYFVTSKVHFGSCDNYFSVTLSDRSVYLSFLVKAKTQDDNGNWFYKNVFMKKTPAIPRQHIQ